MPELWIAFAVALAAWGYLTYVRSKSFLHILQLEEYFTEQYLRWLKSNTARYLTGKHVWALVYAVLTIVAVLSMNYWTAVLTTILWGLSMYVLLRIRRSNPKKPLVMTARARRISIVALGLTVVGVALATGIGALAGTREAVAAGVVATTMLGLFAGHVIAAANLLLYPFEERTRRRFQNMASRKIRDRAPKIIAITGSAGKTTTKELVAHMLAARFRVLRTPSSFNTPMGISRTVNDALTDQDYFVCEMGAYRKGEIEKLSKLVGGNDICVITTVNAQHLERFGSLEKTAEAKFEIVEGLKPGGTAVLNFDVPAVRMHASLHPNLNLVTFGVESDDMRLRGRNVREQEGGIEMDVIVDGVTTPVRTPLLGKHNAGNVLAALGVGLACGLDMPYMAAALRQAQGPEHRLQPVKLGTGGIVLDDGYNGNPQGIIGALEVLGSYAPKRRIIVTPGLIEMGKEKAKYHGDIGRAAAANVDLAFLVGPKQTEDIRAAMLEAGFHESNIHTVRSFAEAQEYLTANGGYGPDNVVLYANDLPDQFDEFLVI
jgi:UDP-N-acetylmuramoyl-tripeptide--D-alanyl-D-alanine ligase